MRERHNEMWTHVLREIDAVQCNRLLLLRVLGAIRIVVLVRSTLVVVGVGGRSLEGIAAAKRLDTPQPGGMLGNDSLWLLRIHV